MKRAILFSVIIFFIVSAQAQQYSDCYNDYMKAGQTLFDQEKYSDAKNMFSLAVKCKDGNPSAAKEKIRLCDEKIRIQEFETSEKNSNNSITVPEDQNSGFNSDDIGKEEIAVEIPQENSDKQEEGNNEYEGKPCPESPTVTDYDGNNYKTVQLGKQCWMAENLRTTHFADGTAIPIGNGCSTQFYNPNDYGRYYPDNNNRNVAVYGYLYNWATTMRGEPSSSNNPSGVQGVCPTGWHVPSEGEWDQLQRHLTMQKQYSCDGKIKNTAKALAATTGWKETQTSCSPGYMMQENNTSGFNAMPAGGFSTCIRLFSGMTPLFFSWDARFWTSTASKQSLFPNDACTIRIGYNDKKMDFDHGGWGYTYKVDGYSVRCVRD